MYDCELDMGGSKVNGDSAKGDIVIGREREDGRIIHRTSGKTPSSVESSWHANEVREVAKTEIVGSLFQKCDDFYSIGPFSAKVWLRTLQSFEGETSQPWPHSQNKKEAGVQI